MGQKYELFQMVICFHPMIFEVSFWCFGVLVACMIVLSNMVIWTRCQSGFLCRGPNGQFCVGDEDKVDDALISLISDVLIEQE